MILFHGGAPEMWRGKVIKPDMAHGRYLDNCPQCQAQKRGEYVPGFDPATPHGWVYATSDREYARYYASRYGKGWLYEVEMPDDAERSTEDHFPSWRAPSALVVRVLEKRITLTMPERRELFRRWGGSDGEFNAMLRGMGIQP